MCISWCADLITLLNARCNDKDSLKIYFTSSSETLNVLDVNETSSFIKGRELVQAAINFCDLPPYKKADSNLGPVVGYLAEDKRCFCSVIPDNC